ncbi:MAG TPA: ATP synthase F1 subunit delta [Candidatus Cybelea sp.]
MVNQTLARRYAVAVDMVARDRGISQKIASDLTAISHAIGDHGKIYEFFASPVVPRPDKERLLTAAFGQHVDPVALHTLLLLVRKRRETLLGALLSEYLALQRAARGAETLVLTSARPLDRGEYAALVGNLERVFGKKFEVTERVDPKLIGGVRIVMGDRRIDASIAGRLDSLARELTTIS